MSILDDSAVLEQLETVKAALALKLNLAQDEAESFQNKAATLQSALRASEQQRNNIQENMTIASRVSGKLGRGRKGAAETGRREWPSCGNGYGQDCAVC